MDISSKTAEEIDSAREKEDLKKLEAVFFISGRYLSMEDLISLSDLNPIIIRELIEKLQEKYSSGDFAIEIIKKNDQWKMDVRQEYFDIINKMATGSTEFSKAEQETLAIIAFKQPIKQSVIIKIRGNKAYDHIKKFVGLNLLKKKKEGHTYILNLAEDFYDYFAIKDEGEGSNILKQVPEDVEEAVEEAEAEMKAEEEKSEVFEDKSSTIDK